MMKLIRQLYINSLTFYLLALVVLFYVIAFFIPVFIWIANFTFLILLFLSISDLLLLFSKRKGIEAIRVLPEKLSNGDDNFSQIEIKNNYDFNIRTKTIDEVPFQFQLRNFEINKNIKKHKKTSFEYTLSPKQRGTYTYGMLNIYVETPIGIFSKRYKFSDKQSVKSYPSFIHLPKYELMAMQNEFLLGGIKKIRKIGHTMEFEQIKDYVSGDDIRTINWKATAKRAQLMVNQYQEERSQRIYMLIDKGRTMKMPFNGLTLLDYSINASMALAHIVLKKKDHAGILTFAKKIEDTVVAESKSGQLRKIAEALYRVKTNFFESDYSRLYVDLKHRVKRRSLVILFTNFETLDALKRQLSYLRGIAKSHVLVVVFFKNQEFQQLIQGGNAASVQDVYDQIIAEKFEYEKKLIRQELQKYGIHSIYTLPKDLNISVINKYLEIKARGVI